MKKKCNNSNSKAASRIFGRAGFTLAEVLITLAIVGVVAALTLPNLIADYQKKQTVTQLKRVYTTFANAFEMAKVDHGDYNTWEWNYVPAAGGERSQYFMDTYIFPYLNIVKKCVPATKECFADQNFYLNGSKFYTFNSSTRIGFVLEDGVTVLAWAGGDGFIPHARFMVDINGFKKPNVMGRDIFSLEFRNSFNDDLCAITNDSGAIEKEFSCSSNVGFHFEGINYVGDVQDYFNSNVISVSTLAKNQNMCSKNSWGNYCGAAIHMNNWEIPEGYPW